MYPKILNLLVCVILIHIEISGPLLSRVQKIYANDLNPDIHVWKIILCDELCVGGIFPILCMMWMEALVR